MNTDLNIDILIPDRLGYWCKSIDLPEGAIDALQAMAVQVRANVELKSAFVELHEKTALRGEWHREWTPLPVAPEVETRCSDDSSLFYLLGYLSVLPLVCEVYERLGIGMDVFRATMRDIAFYVKQHHENTGRWGFSMFQWIWRHLAVELFRLGRLQYMLVPFSGGVRAFRRQGVTGVDKSIPTPVLLADPQTQLRADGYAWGAGRQPDAPVPPVNEETWHPIFETSSDGWCGHPIAPEGWVHRSPIRLTSDEWELILEPGDTVLDLHIPRDGTLDVASCASSHAQAEEFFARIFPQRHPRALFCHTWMFSPQLQTILPASSNIVRFQRNFLLYPSPGTKAFLWNFVFANYADTHSAPRDTTLRRAVLDHLDEGGEIFDVPGLLFHSPLEW